MNFRNNKKRKSRRINRKRIFWANPRRIPAEIQSRVFQYTKSQNSDRRRKGDKKKKVFCRSAKMVKTTKGGKVMNPTDAYRKELRKKELKRVRFCLSLFIFSFSINFYVFSFCFKLQGFVCSYTIIFILFIVVENFCWIKQLYTCFNVSVVLNLFLFELTEIDVAQLSILELFSN